MRSQTRVDTTTLKGYWDIEIRPENYLSLEIWKQATLHDISILVKITVDPGKIEKPVSGRSFHNCTVDGRQNHLYIHNDNNDEINTYLRRHDIVITVVVYNGHHSSVKAVTNLEWVDLVIFIQTCKIYTYIRLNIYPVELVRKLVAFTYRNYTMHKVYFDNLILLILIVTSLQFLRKPEDTLTQDNSETITPKL